MDRHIKENVDSLNFVKRFFFGGIAGICGKTIIAPIERIKYIFVTSSRYFTFREGFHEANDIVNKTGFIKLWRGNILNVVRVFPYAALVI